MRTLIIAVLLAASGCATAPEVAEVFDLPYGVGVEVTWNVAADGATASCGHTQFGLPSNPAQDVTCHWACGQLDGTWQTVRVTFPHPDGAYVEPVEVWTSPVCFQ